MALPAGAAAPQGWDGAWGRWAEPGARRRGRGWEGTAAAARGGGAGPGPGGRPEEGGSRGLGVGERAATAGGRSDCGSRGPAAGEPDGERGSGAGEEDGGRGPSEEGAPSPGLLFKGFLS